MGLRVYLIQNNGETDFIDYGLEAKGYKGILKVEIREETSKVKTWVGSKFVGIPEIDNPKKKIKKKVKKNSYEIFDSTTHDTDKEYYWVTALCSNCHNTSQLAILKKKKVVKQNIENTACSKCNCKKTLYLAKWNGKEYVKI